MLEQIFIHRCVPDILAQYSSVSQSLCFAQEVSADMSHRTKKRTKKIKKKEQRKKNNKKEQRKKNKQIKIKEQKKNQKKEQKRTKPAIYEIEQIENINK